MGWWEDAWSDVGEAFEDLGEAIVDVGEAIVDVVEDVVDVVVDVAEDVAEWTLNTLDDTVFDTVDFITGGAIDIDYDDGQFSAGLDIGIASVGVSFGDQGFSADSSFDIGLASGEISYDSSDGLAMSGSIGVEFGPLPYAEGHMTWSPEGEISIGGVVQGTLPLPFGGEIGGSLSGGFQLHPDGSWGATSDREFDLSSIIADVSIDTTTSVGEDAFGTSYRHTERDEFIDLDGDGVNDDDRPDDDLDDMIGGGVFGSTPGVDAGSLLPPTGQSMQEATKEQGLESETTRPNDGADDPDLDDVTLDFLSPPPVGPNGPPTMDALPVDEFAPVDEFVPVDAFAPADAFVPVDEFAVPVDEFAVPVDEFADPGIPEPLPEPPPPSDFAVEIATIDNVEVEADEMWDDLG